MNLSTEIAANLFNAVCILLAGRNSVHTWWTGIVACAIFGWVFFSAQLYADMTLQGFFVITGVVGWWNWKSGAEGEPLSVRRARPELLLLGFVAASLVTAGYGWLLYRYTDAYAPLWDSAVLAFSVFGQLLLMGRRVESWWCWLLVNTISAPLFFSRGLVLTSVLYAGFWVNALISLRHWTHLASGEAAPTRVARA